MKRLFFIYNFVSRGAVFGRKGPLPPCWHDDSFKIHPSQRSPVISPIQKKLRVSPALTEMSSVWIGVRPWGQQCDFVISCVMCEVGKGEESALGEREAGSLEIQGGLAGWQSDGAKAGAAWHL